MAFAPLRLALLPVSAFMPLSNSADGSSPAVVWPFANIAATNRQGIRTIRRRSMVTPHDDDDLHRLYGQSAIG
jgi:hypothetical protein